MPHPPDTSTIVQPTRGHGRTIVHTQSDPESRARLPSALLLNDIEEGGPAVRPMITLRELSMLHFMNAITDKENWHIKIFDDEIATKWKREAIEAARELYRQSQPNDNAPDENTDDNSAEARRDRIIARYAFHTAPRDECAMTDQMADYCIAELRHKAAGFKESTNGATIVYSGNVVKSDTAVSSNTMKTLQNAVGILEDVPDHYKDWHPGSDGKVLDLVHPSLFPLIYGTSKVIPIGNKALDLDDCLQRIGEGETIPVPDASGGEGEFFSGFHDRGTLNPYSDKFQWIPCEVDIKGEKARIVSYINNLHPHVHKDLYHLIEDVMTAAIPLWELTLAPLADRICPAFRRITYDDALYDPNPSAWYTGLERAGPVQDDITDDDLDLWDVRRHWTQETRRVVLPEPDKAFNAASYENAQPKPLSLKEDSNIGQLQVIVKLANIELTPEKPEYEGGTWHVEGKANENIVATALYYYSSSNITKSSLAFRQLSDAEQACEMGYEQSVHDFLTAVFGCSNEEAAVQTIGSVETREGRLLTFPNVLQHQVQPFSLEDRTKPGHRKILALFLVDPNVRIPSTAVVPPQQLDWFREDLEQVDVSAADRILLDRLPKELKDQVYQEVEFPMSLKRAKELREELMAERKNFVVEHGKAFLSTEFSLCEH